MDCQDPCKLPPDLEFLKTDHYFDVSTCQKWWFFVFGATQLDSNTLLTERRRYFDGIEVNSNRKVDGDTILEPSKSIPTLILLMETHDDR